MEVILKNHQAEAVISIGRLGILLASFRDILHEKEWIYMEEGDRERMPDKGFDQQYKGGMDILFPADEEEVFEEKNYRDHGQLWRISYQWKQSGNCVTAWGKDKELEIRAVIEMELIENRFVCRTYIKNESGEPLPYLFRFHPAFCFGRGTKLYLHGQEMLFEEGEAYCSVSAEDIAEGRIDLEKTDTLKEEEVFVHLTQSQGSFSIKQGERRLKAEYDHQKLPYLTYCTFPKEGKQIGILEPANAPGISLTSISKRQRAPTLLPGEEIFYGFSMILE